jgi:mRNA interferase MazF
MKLHFGDIVLANFEPSMGKEYKKVGPALVVQMEKITTKSPYITLLPISSKLQKMTNSDVFISQDKKNHLAVDSCIKVHQISSFDKRRVVKRFGQANSPVLRKVRGYLRKHFGF